MEKIYITIIILVCLLTGVILGQIIYPSHGTNAAIENNSSSSEQSQLPISPYYLVPSINNSIIIHDQQENSLYKVSADGKILVTIRGDATEPPLLQISGICTDSKGNMYAADVISDKIFKFDKDGSLQLVWGETGSESGEFMAPTGLTLLKGNSEQISVCDSGNRRIQVFDTAGKFLESYSIIGDTNSKEQGVMVSPTSKPLIQQELRIQPEKNANPKSVERNIEIKCTDEIAPVTLTIDRSMYLGAQKMTGNSMDVSTKNPEEWVPVLKQRLIDPVTKQTLNQTLTELQKNARTYQFVDTVELDYIVQFVQQIPLSNDPDFKYPNEIIHDKSGNTFDKALMLYGLLYEMGYDVVYISYPGLSHGAVGIRTEDSLKNSRLVTYTDPDDNEYLLIDPDFASYMGRIHKQVYQTSDPYIIHILPKDESHSKIYIPNKYLSEILDSINKLYEKYDFLTERVKGLNGDDLKTAKDNIDKIKAVLEYIEKNPWNIEGAYMRIKNSKVNEITV